MTVTIDGTSGINGIAIPVATDTFGIQSQAVRQIVSTFNGTMATGTTTIPLDNTVPQNTEGDQYMSLTITPKSATSTLKITVTFFGSHSGSPNTLMVALFQDSNANALAVGTVSPPGAGYFVGVNYVFVMTSGTTSSTTFKVRAGAQTAGTTTFNGSAGGAYLGGAIASSIVIEEIGG